MMAIHREGHKGGPEYGIDAHLAIAQGNNIWVAGWNSHHFANQNPMFLEKSFRKLIFISISFFPIIFLFQI
jgi:hypothetical protein